MVSRSAEVFSLPLPPAASVSLRQIAPPRHRRTFRQPRGATADSGLRSSDINSYNKKLLGTSPALIQEVTLPANFMLRNVSSLAPGFEAGVRLLQDQGGRRPSTLKSYDQTR
jgi:hypothetical protein